MKTPLLIGILMMLFGIVIGYWINRRRFNRRGPSGLEHFSNYEQSIATRSVEAICKLIAYAFILIGLFLMINNW